MDLYAQNILNRYKEPFYKGKKIKSCADEKQVNHSCGDRLEVKLEIDDDKIKAYSFDGAGCAISQAGADIIGDLIIGKTVNEVLDMSKQELFDALGIEISPRREKCATLAIMTVRNALLKYKGGKADTCCCRLK